MESDIEKKYKKIIKLHQGVDTEVWLVNNSDDGKKYIEKIIYKTDLILSRIKDIKSNFIPKIIYMIEDTEENKTYVIEEFIEGENLGDYLEKGKSLNENEVKNVILSICDVLSCLHDEEIAHQDIKPSNIIYTSKKETKLIDFDAAVEFGPNKSTPKNKNGTEGFAAPEQYICDKLIDERTDIYSLGVTINQLLGDKYKGYLNDIVAKCTEFNPDDRYANINEIIYAIKNKKKTERRKKIYGKIHYEGLEKWSYRFLYTYSVLTIIGLLLLVALFIFKNEISVNILVAIYIVAFFNSFYIGKKILEYVSSLEMYLLYQDYGADKKKYLLVHFFISLFGYFGIMATPAQKIFDINIERPESFWIVPPLIIISIFLSVYNCKEKCKKIS